MALYLREPDAKPVDLGMQFFMRADVRHTQRNKSNRWTSAGESPGAQLVSDEMSHGTPHVCYFTIFW